MTATEVVLKMASDYEMKTGKRPTEIKLAPRLYDSLKAELRGQSYIKNDSTMVIDYIELRGTRIERAPEDKKL